MNINLYNRSEIIADNNIRYFFDVDFKEKSEFLEMYHKNNDLIVELGKLEDVILTYKDVNIICDNKRGVSLVIQFLKHRNKW